MIKIYDINDKLLMQAEVTSAAKREQEMSKSDYISLSFSAAEKVILPAGAYINYTYKIDTVREVTRKFLLLESYEPIQSDECSWKYTPQFQHPKMILSKTPFFIYTRNSQNVEVKQNVWSFVGTTSALSGKIADFLNKDLMFGECGWKVIFQKVTANTINVSFSDNDFISALTAITNAIGDNCEWHIDYDDEIIYIGKVLVGAIPVILEVGKNVGVPSINESKEGYYNAFSIFGGTRNITQVNSKGENVSSGDIRLQLDEGNGTITIDGKECSYSIDKYSTLDLRADKTKEPLFVKVLDLSQIYPSLNTYVYNVRGRVKYVLDENKKKIPISYNADGSVKEYKTFTVWYMRLAYPTTEKVAGKTIINTTVDDGVTHYWYNFEVTDDLLINGKNIGCSFEANFNTGALSTPLAGRGTNGDYVGFELIYHKEASSSHTSDDVSKDNFSVLAGDYEIIYQQDNEVIIPTNKEEMLIPRGENKPSLKCNITVLYNIAMANTIYYEDAQNRLLEKAKEEIVRLLSDLNNYEVKSYSDVFLEDNPQLQIGQSVTYKDGHGYELATRVLKLSTNIDYDFIQSITLGNQAIKGTITQLKEDVQTIIANGGNSGNGGGFSVSQLRSLIAKYGSDNFISKQFDDIAHGTITWEKIQKLLSGLLVGGFNNENGGSWTPDAEGRSHLITDYLEVRMKAIFEELAIKKNSTIGGKEIISPAGGVAAYKVDEVTVTYNDVSQKAYRCYFLAEQDGDEVDNDFVVEDQVRSESFNLNAGKYHKTGNHFFWRMVIGIDEEPVDLEGKKYHYIDLSDTDCATASDVPAKGDVLSQCGNRTDVERQNCLIFSAVDTYSPSISLYHGINSYSFANKEYVEYGVNKQTNKAFFNVYGDAYIGDRPTKDNNYEGDSYVKYDSEQKKVIIKAELSVKSTLQGNTLEETFKDIQKQFDRKAETWYQAEDPSIAWETDLEKSEHKGDLWYNTTNGETSYWNGSSWQKQDIPDAVFDMIDGKSSIYVSKPSSYEECDLWILEAAYTLGGVAYTKGELVTAIRSNTTFNAADWTKKVIYTDDTEAKKAQASIKETQTNLTNLGNTVKSNRDAFDKFTEDGYLDSSEIAAIAQDSKRLEDAFAAAEKSYNEVANSDVLSGTSQLTDLKAAFGTDTTGLLGAKKELIAYIADIVTRYNAADSDGKKNINSRVATLYDNFQAAYDTFYNKLGLASAYITSTIIGKLNAVIGDVATYNYLKEALSENASTDINGGLILSSLIALRDPKTGYVQSGINGIVDNTAKGNGIATWWGGYMNDGQVVGFDDKGDVTKNAATSLIRFDGSGYLANGAIYWGVDGKVHADPTSFIISEKNLGAYLAFFEPTWKSGSDGSSIKDLVALTPQAPFKTLTVSNDLSVEGKLKIGSITLSVVNGALKIDGNVYSTGGMSAYGEGTSNGGGLNGSIVPFDKAKSLTAQNEGTEIASAWSIKKLYDMINSIDVTGQLADYLKKTEASTLYQPKGNYLTSHQTIYGLTIQKNGTSLGTYTPNSAAKTINVTVPTKLSELSNDSGYTKNTGTVTSVAISVPTGLSVSGSPITTNGTIAIALASGYSIPTTAKQTAWDGAVSAKHTHSNKSVLDGISSTKVSHWNSAYDWYALMTTDEETADGIINKWNEVVSFLANIAQTDTLSGIVDGINKSISDEVTRAKKAEGANASGISTNKTNITTLQGYFTSGSAKKALQLTNARKLWGNSFNGTADINGSIIVPSGKYISIGNIKLEYDATNKALKITNTTTNEVANLYTSGGVSAYGVGTSSSSGGGLNGSVKSYSDALKLTSESLSEVASAYSIKALDSRISSLEGGSATAISVSGSGNAVTSVTKNGTTISIVKGSTFLTNHQSLDGYVNAISVSGSGNAITSVSKSGKGITFTKGATFLTSHQSLANYYTKSSVDSLLSGKSATSHTHSVKINGITKTIAASGGDAVDLGTYLTAHQSLAAYATQNWVKNEATAHNADMVDNYHASGLFTGFSISDVANKVTISIGGTSKALNLVRAFPSGVGNNFNDIATHGNSMGMSNIAAPYASSTANYQTLNGYVNPNGQTGWHHYINLSYTDSNNTATSPNMWQTQFAIKAGTTEVYVRSRAGGKISNDAAWAAPWVRLARVTDNVASASKVANALSWSGYSSGSYNGSAAKSISIPNNTNQLTNGAGFITASASISGNAGSATKLQNPRTINGTSFNGTANIVTSYWGTTRKLWGNSVNGNADVNGSITIANTDGVYVQIGDVRLVYDKANTAIKVVKSDGTTAANFYATGGITAYGEGSGSSGGGGLNGSVKSYADALKLTSESLSEIASAYSIKALDSRISSLEGGSATSIETTGSGNAVTSVSKSGTKITFTKGSTFSLNGHTHTFASLTSKPTSLSGYGITDGVNAISVTGSGNAVTAASVSGHTLTLTKGSTFSLSNHTHYVGTTRIQSSSAEQALTGITKIDNILKLSKATVTVNTSYKAEQNRLVIYGSTYGNDANYIKSAGKLSYGDGGPQLVFSTGENPDASGVQSAALVYTDHDKIGAGVSLSFVTNQGDAYFIAPHIKALTAFQGNLAWSYITNKPTTLSGFGITDGLRSVTQPSGSNVFVTGISTSGTAVTYTKSYTKKSLSAVGTSGWTNASTDGNIIPDMSFIAHWNGAYSGTSSNLAYCNKGAFGSFAIKNSLAFSELTSKPTTISGYGITDAYTKSQVDAIAAKYLPLTGGTLTGQLKIVASALNGAYNGLLIGDDCYIGDCNLGNTIGLMGVGNNNAGMVKFGKGGMQFGYNGSNHIASTTAQWTNLNADLLDGWHKDNIVWSGAVNSNTASLSHYWAKLFDITVTGNQYDDRSFTFLFSNGYNDTYSVVVLKIRQNGAKGSGAYNFSISLRELVGNMSSRLRVYYNNATGNVQLWGNCQGQYGSLSYTIIKKTGRTSADFTSQGTLVTNTSFSAAQSLPATTGDSPYTLLDGATRIGIVKQADQLVTARSLWGQSFNGTANVSGALSGATTISASNTISTTLQNGALKIGNKLTPISAIDAQVIFNTGAAIRFGEKNWNWDEWAGLKYTHSNKTVYLGIANGSVFNANNAQSYGKLQLKAIDSILFDSDLDSFQIYCDNSYERLRIGSSDNSGYVLVSDIGNWDTDGEDEYGANNWRISIDGSSWFKKIYCPSIYTANSINSTSNKALLLSGNVIREYHHGGSLYYSSITFKDTTLALSAYGNIGLTSTQGITIDGGNGTISMVATGGFDVTYRAASLSVSQTGASEYTWTFNQGSIKTTGGITAYQSSDERLKHNIHGVDSLAIIKAMGGTVAFRYNEDDKASIGWIAQRVLHNTLMQDLVEKDDEGFLKINYWSPKLIAVAFGAIEQVDDEVANLKARVRELENEVEQLKSDRL